MARNSVKLLIFVVALLAIPLANAVYLASPTNLTTTISNSTLTFSVPITVDLATILSHNITLENITCGNGAPSLSQIFWNVPNSINDSSSYCILVSSTIEEETTLTQRILNLIPGMLVIALLLIVSLVFWYNKDDMEAGELTVLLIKVAVVILIAVVFIKIIAENI